MITWKYLVQWVNTTIFCYYNNDIMTEFDHFKAWNIEFDMLIQSEEFGFNLTFSIKFSAFRYDDKGWSHLKNEAKLNMDFRSHFSYDFANIAYTRCEHVKSSFTECTRKICSLEMVYYMIL